MQRARSAPPTTGALALAVAGVTPPLAAAERLQGRSQVICRQGIVASEHPLASQAGAQVLAEGGTAVDAAIAANAVMGVVAPMTCGLGGDLFALVYEAKTGRLHGLNASGWAPSGLSPEALRARGFTNMPQRGIWSVTIPGCVAGWDALRARFGLQNRGGLFTLDPGHPNALAPRKRPLHTIIPAFMERGAVRIAFGIMGGWNQAQAHAQFVAHVADFGLNLQTALEAPRFTKLTFDGVDVEIEARVPETIRAALAARGHTVKTLPAFADAVGGGQAVMRDFARGINYGASDPRKDGAAVPEPIR